MNEVSLKNKRILIIGGTNKVLQLASKKFLEKGCEKVTILSLHKDETLDLIKSPNIKIIYGDIHYLNSKELSIAMMYNHYLVIASSKTTKRAIADENVDQYYFERNIEDTENLLRIAKLCKIEKVLILGTHYCSMDRKYTHLKLAQRHPYIKNRQMQEDMAMSNATNKIQIMTLELPYILGRNFQMTGLFDLVALQIVANKPVPYFAGGGVFCTMEEAAQSIVNIFEVGESSKIYTLATMNLTWEQIIKEAKSYYGNKSALVKFGTLKINKVMRKFKKENDKNNLKSGLNYKYYSKLLTCEEKFDTYAISTLLKLNTQADWKTEVHKTVDYVKEKYLEDLKLKRKKAKLFI